MPREVITEEEKARLSALEMKDALGGVDEEKEKQSLFDLRKKKKLQQAIDKNQR